MKSKVMLVAGAMCLFMNAAGQDNTVPVTGNVGIGTINPNVKLDVNGKVKIDSTLIVRDSATFERSMIVQENMRIEGDSKLNNVDLFGYLNVTGVSSFNGNVHMPGLNSTANPANKGMLLTNALGQLEKVPFDSLSSSLKSQLYAAPLPFDPCLFATGINPNWSNGPGKIYVACPDAFVGVATNTPQTNLDVQGTTFTKRLALNADPTQMGTRYFHMKVTDQSPAYQNASVFLIENTSRALFQINNDGTVRAREVRVNLDTAWPDYVFESSYDLKPLSEVASFIRENGHLPNVPSAKEVEEKGVSLGEMDRILLEKVEELTLHMIEQQKLIEQQQQLIERQNERINQLEAKE